LSGKFKGDRHCELKVCLRWSEAIPQLRSAHFIAWGLLRQYFHRSDEKLPRNDVLLVFKFNVVEMEKGGCVYIITNQHHTTFTLV